MEEVHLMQERDPAAKAIVFSQVKIMKESFESVSSTTTDAYF